MALGDIVQVLDTQGFALLAGQPLNICMRNDNVVVLFSQKTDTVQPFVRSIGIDNSGQINATPLGSLMLWNVHGRDPALIHWSGNTCIVLNNDQNAAVRLISFSVSDAGVIPATIIDDLSLSAASNTTLASFLLQPHPTVIITGSSNPGDPNHIETAVVTAGGSFAAGLADSMQLSARPIQQRFRKGAGNMIVGAFTAANHVHIFTFTCDGTGGMPATPTDTWDALTTGTNYVAFAKVTDLVYAIFTIDDDGEGRIRTFNISGAGVIDKSFDDTEVVDTVVANSLDLVEMSEGYFIASYGVTGIPGRLKTYYISDAGVITDGHIGTLDIAETDFAHCSIIYLQGNIWVLAFLNTSSQIMLYTLEITTPGVAIPHHEMMMGMGP